MPAYFDRELAVPRAPAVHLPFATAGTGALAVGALTPVGVVATVGAALWAVGVAIFLAAMGWTLRGNFTGRETGTGEAKADRRPVDRYANAFVPVALAYLAWGSYEVLAAHSGLPPLLDGYGPRASHLLAAGTAALLIFAVGFRLLPRFLVAYPPRPLVAVVLPAGAAGPAVVAATLPAGRWFALGAALEATAVLGFAAAYGYLFATSDRRRVGFYAVLAAATAGAAAALLGLHFAVGSLAPGPVAAHARLNLLGFLGLTVVGVTYQFYPPAVGQFPAGDDRTAYATVALLAGGLAVEAVGLLASVDAAVLAGEVAVLVGAAGYAYLLANLLRQMRRRGGRRA